MASFNGLVVYGLIIILCLSIVMFWRESSLIGEPNFISFRSGLLSLSFLCRLCCWNQFQHTQLNQINSPFHPSHLHGNCTIWMNWWICFVSRRANIVCVFLIIFHYLNEWVEWRGRADRSWNKNSTVYFLMAETERESERVLGIRDSSWSPLWALEWTSFFLRNKSWSLNDTVRANEQRGKRVIHSLIPFVILSPGFCSNADVGFERWMDGWCLFLLVSGIT